MERYVLFLTRSQGFSPVIASVGCLGGQTFPDNSRSFATTSALATALEAAGVEEHVWKYSVQAVANGYNSWIEIGEAEARHFARMETI